MQPRQAAMFPSIPLPPYKKLQSGLFVPQLDNPEEIVRALSWKQPFATVMLPPDNKVETRTWHSMYKGWVLICASAKGYKPLQYFNICGAYQFARLNHTISGRGEEIRAAEGHAIAIGRLIDCKPMEKENEDASFVKFFPDLYCHFYSDVYPIKPIPWKGSQGWRILTPEQKSKIIIL